MLREAYQTYCVGLQTAADLLESLQDNVQFQDFLSVSVEPLSVILLLLLLLLLPPLLLLNHRIVEW